MEHMTPKGSKLSEEHKRKISQNNAKYWLGKKIPKEAIKKAVETRNRNGGFVVSEETRKKISRSMRGMNRGKNNPRYGKVVSEGTRKKMSLSHKGENHWNWCGGKSLEEYSIDWRETLRRSIRERDHYSCRLCGTPQGDIAHDIHHINYDKKDNSPDNLITLCHICHSKTNFNRDYWIKFFRG